jgi:p24 family protein delta-1
LTIPEDDDAHVVLLALPGLAAEEDEENPNWATEHKELEEHFVFQMAEMQKYRVRSTLPRKFPNTPSDQISKHMKKFITDKNEGELKSGCKITISNPKSTASRAMESFWFTPLVLNHLRKSIRASDDVGRKSNPLEGYEFCFENTNEEAPVQILMESVLLSDPDTGLGDDEKPVFESSNLTPLAEQLSESIDYAESVLKEMRYMEGREHRMRQTSDSINARVRYFSYISVSVLLVVTYVQVTYLKRYFRKKKLL